MRWTEAEVLEKYGMHPREAVGRELRAAGYGWPIKMRCLRSLGHKVLPTSFSCDVFVHLLPVIDFFGPPFHARIYSYHCIIIVLLPKYQLADLLRLFIACSIGVSDIATINHGLIVHDALQLALSYHRTQIHDSCR